MNRSVVTHQSTAWWCSHRTTSRCTAGSARRQRSGRGGKRVAWATPIGMAMSLSQLQPKQKAQGQHHRDRMPVVGGVGEQHLAVAQIGAQHAHLVVWTEGPGEQPVGVQPLQPLTIEPIGLRSAGGALGLAGIDEEHLQAPGL